VTYPGLGGQQPPPQNASPAAQLVPGVQPGTTGQVVASRVIIIGSGGELLVYSPTQGAGNLIASIAGTTGTDPFGNNFLSGTASYGSAFAASLLGGAVQYYTGSLAGGWTATAIIEADSLGNLLIAAGAGRVVETPNNVLDDGSGNASILGTLSVGGSTSTGNPSTTGFVVTTSGNFNGGTLTSHNHSYGHTHPL